ncbi:MAG: PD-(D/E)XK nuclease family protein, partial [Planctomycetota bacterium]|nr:PD-(D/E)XK nuclease family protein [Planctomycetota bacterium]
GKRDGLQGEIHEGASHLEERARRFGMPKTLQSFLEGRPAGGDGWASLLLEWRERLAEPRGPEEMAALIEDALADGIRPTFESRGGSADGDPLFWHDRFRRESAALASVRDAVRESGSPLLWGGTRALVSSADLLRTVSEAVLESKVPLRDRRLNCVNVIDAREARHWDSLRVVFVAGLLEKEFPIYPREDIFIRDSERRQLNENTKLSLRENLRQRDEERYLFYVAATRARDLLYLCNPAHDSGGKETQASLYVAEISRLFPEEGIEIEEATLADPCPLPDRASLREDLEMGIARSIGSAPPPEVLALYETAPDRSIFSGGRAFLRARGASLEAEDLREAIHQAVRHVSASGINDFIRCPHLYFVTRVLKLGEPPPGIDERLDYRDLGSIAHRALERYHEAGGKRPIHDVIQEALEEIVGQLDLGLRREVALAELRRSLGYTLEREARDAGPFKPAALETKLESVVLPLPDGDIRLEGRLDRIDEAEIDGRRLRILVDYKRSKGFQKRTLEMLEEMTDVQLPFYLLASRIAGGPPVVGVELYPLRERTRGGIYLKDVEAQVGGRVESKRHSLFLSEDEFEHWVDLCREVISEAIHRIRAGDLGR